MDQQVHRLWREPLYRLTIAFGIAFEKMLRQLRNIFPSPAQRRYLDGHDVESVIEILAKAPGAHLFRKVAMGGGDKPHINGKRLVAADPLHLPLLNRPQQADLHHWRDIAYLIKKQRAAIRFDKASFPPPIRPGKRPFFMAEEFRLQQ